jgi:hypothetical protein
VEPEILPPRPDGYDHVNADDVGDFTQGNAITRYALGRYLLGRALATYISRALLILGVAIFALAMLLWFLNVHVLAVLISLVALAVLAIRAIVSAVLRRLTSAATSGEAERRLRALVADTRGDVGRELRRIGLPGRAWSLPLLGLRLLGKRRATTAARLKQFDVERVVPPGRLDELHMIVSAQAGRGFIVG